MRVIGVIVFYLVAALTASLCIESNILASLVADVFVILAVGRLYKQKIGDMDRRYTALPKSMLFLGVFITWIISTITLTWLAIQWPDLFGERVKDTMSDSDAGIYLMLTILVAPIAEELVFRGVVFRYMAVRMSTVWAYLLSSFLFAVFHMSIPHLYGAVATGLLFVLVYDWTGSIKSSIFAHMLYNLLSVVLSGVAIVPDWCCSLPVVVAMNLLYLFAFCIISIKIESHRFSYLDKTMKINPLLR